jgi:hypothetical protein
MVETGSVGPTLAVISVITTTVEAAQALAPVRPTLLLQLRSIPPPQLRVTLLEILLVRMEVMVEPLAVIRVELAVMVLRLEVILVLEMMVRPILELEEMPMVEVILPTEMGRIMVTKLRAVTVMAEMMLLRVGMVEMLLLLVMLRMTVETPTEVMEETSMAETEEMRMVVMAAMGPAMEAMAEVGMETVTQETQMIKPMMMKS